MCVRPPVLTLVRVHVWGGHGTTREIGTCWRIKSSSLLKLSFQLAKTQPFTCASTSLTSSNGAVFVCLDSPVPHLTCDSTHLCLN
jgi:hypothetical protein